MGQRVAGGVWIVLALALACDGGERDHRSDAGADAGTDRGHGSRARTREHGSRTPDDGPRVTHAPLSAGTEIAIPEGIVRAGSLPGTPGRDARTEADLVAVSVPAFQVDRLPYPNDPSAAPRTGVTRAEAAELCAADGKRLCHELEWERACAGDTGRSFAGGDTFDVEACSIDPIACASPLDVLSMGTALFEWTASDATRGLGGVRWTAVARGGRPSDPAEEHRCAARQALAPDASGGETGFRCCRGETPELAYPDEPERRSFREEAVPIARVREILATIPQLARFAADFELVSPVGVDRALGRGGASRETVQFHFVEDEVLVWSPMRGEELWVIAGTGAGAAVIAALYPMPDGSFVHAASFVLENEPVPVVLAWDQTSRERVLWSACWGCAGEGGSIAQREDGTFVVVQR